MKKMLYCLLIGILFGYTAKAQQQSGITLQLSLEDCIGLALKDNYTRQTVALNEQANLEVYKQSKTERLPNLNASIGETFSHSTKTGGDYGGNYALNIGATLYQGGYKSNMIERNRLALEQSVFRTAQYEIDLTVQVLQAFLTALGNEELLRYQHAVLNASEEHMKQGKIRHGAGELLESDYLLLEAQYANDQNNVLETTISRDNSLNKLKNLMSLDLSQVIEITYPESSLLDAMGTMPSESEVVSRATETLPDLRISDYNVKIASIGVSISKSAGMPTLSLNAGIGTVHSNGYSNYGSQISNHFSEQIGLTLSIPIFDLNRTKTNVAKSRIGLQQAELERKQTALDVQQTLVQEYRSVVLAESKYKSSQIRQNAYLASFKAYQMKFEQGAITAVELLQQQNNYISAMNDYVQSKYAFMLKRKVLDVYMGEPVKM